MAIFGYLNVKPFKSKAFQFTFEVKIGTDLLWTLVKSSDAVRTAGIEHFPKYKGGQHEYTQ